MMTLRTEAEVIRALVTRVILSGNTIGEANIALICRTWNPLQSVEAAIELLDRFVDGYEITRNPAAGNSRYRVAVSSLLREGSFTISRYYAATLQLAAVGAALASIDCEYEPEVKPV